MRVRFPVRTFDGSGLTAFLPPVLPRPVLRSSGPITVPANPVMSSYHDLMPAILHPRDYDEWLDRAEVERAPAHLLHPYDCNDLVVYEANRAVGNVRNDRAELLNSK